MTKQQQNHEGTEFLQISFLWLPSDHVCVAFFLLSSLRRSPASSKFDSSLNLGINIAGRGYPAALFFFFLVASRMRTLLLKIFTHVNKQYLHMIKK